MVTTDPLANIAEACADTEAGRNIRGVLLMNAVEPPI
jgi:hypothetical protein